MNESHPRRHWRERASLETLMLAALLWLCALPLITTLALPRLGALVAALLALVAMGAATWAALALTPKVLRPQLIRALHEDDRTATQGLHPHGSHSNRTLEVRTGRR